MANGAEHRRRPGDLRYCGEVLRPNRERSAALSLPPSALEGAAAGVLLRVLEFVSNPQ